MSKNVTFRPRARLLLQLGDQLIKNESVALLELVKNAYDADAKIVKVSMSNLNDTNNGKIIIEDNGDGMDADIVENVWMEPGSNYKEKIFQANKRSKLGRLPIGEKGIGRFGVHKLGNKIEMVTRMLGKKEVVLSIDWATFECAEYLGDVKIKIEEREPEVFLNDKTGTKIIIKDLKNKWTRGAVRDVYRALNSLNSPFETMESFKVDFSIDEPEWLKGLVDFNAIKDYALYEADIEMEGTNITEFSYYFKPWEAMTKLTSREYRANEIVLVKQTGKNKKSLEEIDLSRYKIGKIKVKLFIFDRDSKTLELAVHDKKGYKEYLDQNGGIRVYRDGMRIFDYGEPENDWLGLDYGRFNAPGVKISNNLVIGTVQLDRETSSDLIEKTNREGFIENEAYHAVKDAISFVIQKVEVQRRIDKDKIRTFYSPSSKSEPVIANLNVLQDTINKRISDNTIKKELTTYVKRIEDDYNRITEIYMKSAGAGLSLSIAIHEMEKILHELIKATDFDKASNRIVELVARLAQLVEGYSTLVKGRDKKLQSARSIIQSSIFNVEYRLKVHGIEIVDGFSCYEGDPKINCAKNLVTSMIVNIIDNSMWWSEYAHIEKKKIFIGISDDVPNYKTIIVADNGPGFSLPTDDIVKPFISDKPEGMGLGLYLANEIMKGHNGKLIFPEFDDLDLPSEFKNGAILGLAFKEEKK